MASLHVINQTMSFMNVVVGESSMANSTNNMFIKPTQSVQHFPNTMYTSARQSVVNVSDVASWTTRRLTSTHASYSSPLPTISTNINTNLLYSSLSSAISATSSSVPYTLSSMATAASTALFNNATNSSFLQNSTITRAPGIYTTEQPRGNLNEPYTTTEIMLLLAFIFIMTFGTLGNGYVYYFFGLKKRSKQTIPEMLFSYLAIFDFTASVINPLLYVNFTLNRNIWVFGEFLCKSTLTLGAVVTTISGGIFIVIAFDRERSIVFPFKSHFKPKTIKLCVAIAIVYAVLMNFHYALNLSIDEGTCNIPDVTMRNYWVPTIICFVIQDLTLIFVFAFTNMRIFDHINSKDTALVLGALWGKRKKDSAKIIRLLVVLATVYFILTLPRDIFIIVHMLSWVVGPTGFEVTPPVKSAYYFIKVLHTANSCVNIFIYYRMHRGFHRHVRYNLCCLFYGREPKNNVNYFDTIITADNSPNIFRRLQSPMRSPGPSRDLTVDMRLINEVNVGKKRTVNERRGVSSGRSSATSSRVASPSLQVHGKESTNLLAVNTSQQGLHRDSDDSFSNV